MRLAAIGSCKATERRHRKLRRSPSRRRKDRVRTELRSTRASEWLSQRATMSTMKRVSLILMSALAACSAPSSAPIRDHSPSTIATVDPARIMHAIEGDWSTSFSGDTVTMTHTLHLRDGVVTETSSMAVMGAKPTTTELGSSAYEISPSGVLSMSLAQDRARWVANDL